MIHIVQVKHPLQKFTDKKIYTNINIKRDITLLGNCCHFATGCLHDYIHFTIYHLQLHVQCSEAQVISAISPKTCTQKLQLWHNMKRPTKWSGHVKMIDPPGNSTYERPFTQEGNYLVCDRLPDTEIIFGIDIQKKFSLSYTWDKEKNYYSKGW